MMTREEKIDAFTMRLDGYTLEEIGEKYDVTKEGIRQMFARVAAESGISRKNYIYPNIADWMVRNNVTQSLFFKELGCCQATISNYLTGKNNPSFEFINKVLEITKMPYEVAFSRERVYEKR